MASRIMPAHVPNTGKPVGEPLRRSASNRPGRLEQHRHRGRLAAGHDQGVDARRGRPACGPRLAARAELSRARRRGAPKAPCSARTPTVGFTWRPRRVSSPAPLGELHRRVSSISRPGMGSPEAAAHLGQDVRRRGSGWWPRRWPWPAGPGSPLLKMPEPTNTASAPSCITSAASAGVAMPPAQNSGTGQPAGLGDLLHERQRRLQALGPVEQLGRVGLGDLADVADDRAQVAHRLDDVAGAGLALRADHARRPR